MSNNFTLHAIGCGSAKPTNRHNPSCTVLDYHGNYFMIDCGEGSQREFQRQHLKFSRLNHIFLTHLHGDHVFGLPGLIGTLALSGIEGEVVIHTIPEGEKILREIIDFFNHDKPLDVRYNIFDSKQVQTILETKSMKVSTIPLRHRVPTAGFLFEEKEHLRHLNREMCDFHGVPISQFNNIKAGMDFTKADGTVISNKLLTTAPTPSKRYAHVSDTMYIPDLGDIIGEVDVLFHESTYLSDKEEKAKQRGHSTARQAAMVARDSGAKKLLLSHYSSSVHDDKLFEEEAKEIFPNTIALYEGKKIEI